MAVDSAMESNPDRARDVALRFERCRYLPVIVFMCCSFLASPQTVAHEPPVALVLSNTTLPPVTTPAGSGYLNKLYAEWFSRAGYRADLVDVPAARALQNANVGIYDGDAARTEVDPALYPDLHRVPEPLFQIVLAGVFFDKDVDVKTAADFEKYRVGYVRGWRMPESLFAGSTTAIPVRHAAGVLDMLEARRLDVGFLTLAPARSLSRERGMKPPQATEFRIERDMYLYLHSSHLDKIPELVDALRVMKSDGSYDAIMAGYVAENQ